LKIAENMKTQITYFYIVKDNQIIFRSFNVALLKKEVENKMETSLYSHTLKWPVCKNLSESDLNQMKKIN